MRTNRKALFECVLLAFACATTRPQWQMTNGPYNTVHSIAVGSGGKTFFGTAQGLRYTTDNGSSWGTGVGHGLMDLEMQKFVNIRTLLASGSKMFAGTDEGVFLSTDEGANWNQTLIGFGAVRALAVGAGKLFAGTDSQGILMSDANAFLWTVSNTGLANTHISSLVVSGTKVFAGTSGGGVFVSADSGQSWSESNNGLSSLNVTALALSGTRVLAGTDGGVYRTTDNGTTWTAVNNGLMNTSVYALLGGATGTVYVCTDGGVFRSYNSGESWMPKNTGLLNLNVRAIARNAYTYFLFAATEDGRAFWSINNGDTWAEINLRLFAYTMFASQYGFFASVGGDVFRSTDDGAHWNSVHNGLFYPARPTAFTEMFNPFAGITLLAAVNGGIFTFNPSGEKWSRIDNGLSGFSVSSMSNNGAEIIAGGHWSWGSGTIISRDYGISWVGFDSTTWEWGDVPSIILRGEYLYKGTNTGVYVTKGSGAKWVFLGHCGCGPWLATNETDIVAGGEATGVYRTSIGSGEWTESSNGLPIKNVYSIAYAVDKLTFSNDKLFAAGGGHGVFYSDDGGTNWIVINEGFPTGIAFYIQTIAVTGGYVFAGSTDYGVWRRPLADFITSVHQMSAETPHTISLSQNYPNPFNPTTKIRYLLSSTTHVVLKVFDILGREILTLVNERQNTGEHSVMFDASNLPSGVYFYRLVAGAYHDTKKLLLLK